MALLNTSARPDTPEQTAARYDFITVAEQGRLDKVAEVVANRYLHRNRQSDETLRNLLRDMAADTGPEAFVWQERVIISRPDSRPLLASIFCPILVLSGDGDELTPPDLAMEISGGIAGARLVIVLDREHLSTVERPEATNAALAEWLSD